MPKKSKPTKERPLYRKPPPKPKGRAGSPLPAELGGGTSAGAHGVTRPTSEFRHPHFLAPAHFTLREDGSIQTATEPPRHGEIPQLAFKSENPFIRIYHGNCLELLDAIAAKYPEGRFDAIFADPPYFLSNGGITCHAGKMVKVDKGDWDVSRGPELNHEFNTE